jgi:hypothetical protein
MSRISAKQQVLACFLQMLVSEQHSRDALALQAHMNQFDFDLIYILATKQRRHPEEICA